MTFAARTHLGSGSAGPTATLTNATYAIAGVGTPASLIFDSNGELWATTDSVIAAYQYDWLTSGSSADCKLVYTVTSGSLSGTPPASGSNMGTTLTFTRAAPASFQSVTIDFQIQRQSDSVVLASATITLECDNS